MRRVVIVAICCFAFCFHSAISQAAIYTFDIFTSNGPWGDGNINEDDPLLVGGITVDVHNGTNPVSGLPSVKFQFQNNIDPSIGDDPLKGPAITDIYFDNGSLFGIAAIVNMPDEGSGFTTFDRPAIPSELPGNTILDPDFITSTNIIEGVEEHFSADSDSPPYHNGVQYGEWVRIEFDLYGDSTLADVFNELDSGALRIGIHIQSFAGGSSESAVNVPEPATMMLLGLGGLALLRRRRA